MSERGVVVAIEMNTHTPGPWQWWTSNWRRLRHSERGASTNVLLPVIRKDGQACIDVTPADMALIAAAPDLLACQTMIVMDTMTNTPYLLDWVAWRFGDDNHGQLSDIGASALRELARAGRAAIAKAGALSSYK